MSSIFTKRRLHFCNYRRMKRNWCSGGSRQCQTYAFLLLLKQRKTMVLNLKMKMLFHITSWALLEESGLKDMTIFLIPLPSKSLAINISGCKTRDEVTSENVSDLQHQWWTANQIKLSVYSEVRVSFNSLQKLFQQDTKSTAELTATTTKRKSIVFLSLLPPQRSQFDSFISSFAIHGESTGKDTALCLVGQ